MSRISLELIPGRERNFSWGRKDEEYMADFILLSRRTLSEFDYKIFRFLGHGNQCILVTGTRQPLLPLSQRQF